MFQKDYKVLHSHFQNTVVAATSSGDMQGRARKIAKEQEKFNTILFACFILDVLECLSKGLASNRLVVNKTIISFQVLKMLKNF